jgi:hypothetical protein
MMPWSTQQILRSIHPNAKNCIAGRRMSSSIKMLVLRLCITRLYKPWLTKVVISPVGADSVAQWRIDWESKQAGLGE